MALNRYYADFMVDYAGIDRERIHIIPHGLKLEGHRTRERSADRSEFTIGYFARICEDKGLHHLVDAFTLLAKDRDLPPLSLRAAGYMGAADRPYLAALERKLPHGRVTRSLSILGRTRSCRKD